MGLDGGVISGAVQGVIGGIQSIIGGINARKAQKKLEKMQTPTYQQNQSVLDLYGKALQRYNTNPYETNLYKMQANNIGRGTATGIGALQDRRSALGGISSLISGQNDANLRAGVGAETQRDQRFNQLSQVTGMKANEDRQAWEQNVYAPFEKNYNLLAMKAGANAQVTNAGMENVFGGLSNISNYYTAKKYYGQK